MTLHISEHIDELLEKLAAYFIFAANQSIQNTGRFSVVLSGGSSPEKLYALLASATYSKMVDWQKVYFFMGDERYVPITDSNSNFNMVSKVLFNKITIPSENIFPVNTQLAPEQSAAAYDKKIQGYFNGLPLQFDMVLLGLGNDSHTASLFPHTDILKAKEATIKSVFIPGQQVYRISFTAPLINMAQRVVFLVYGSGKAMAVNNVLEAENDTEQYPAQLIEPVKGSFDWFLDTTAAAKIIKQ